MKACPCNSADTVYMKFSHGPRALPVASIARVPKIACPYSRVVHTDLRFGIGLLAGSHCHDPAHL